MRTCIHNEHRADFDILCDNFIDDINIRQIVKLPIVTIYQNTKDYPGKFVARLYGISPDGPVHTRYILLADDLEAIRNAIPPGMTQIPSSPSDDPVIVESWI